VLALVLLAVAGGISASTASAGGGATALIKDASDGVVDGTYSAAVVRSALAIVRGDPAYTMYSDIEGVLVDYLASITKPGGGGSSTPKPRITSTPTPGGKATPKATASPKRSPHASKSPTPRDSLSPTTAAAAPSPAPSATAWDQAKSRLASVPWLFAVPIAGVVVVGVILLRRRSA
jgi:hypothetical protein